jgi:oxygen-independent coproporphyrinogen III oxidase
LITFDGFVAGIYIHIPFCRRACLYCDFHFSTSQRDIDQMVGCIVAEAGMRRDYLEKEQIGSVYFGGGTPSLLGPEHLQSIMSAIAGTFAISPGAEVTFEVNPEDVNIVSLSSWKRSGVNRLSVGLQSFDAEELKWMNRMHTGREGELAVKIAQDAGFGNISIDLIYGSRFQDLQKWKHTLEKATALDPTHISSYNLTVEQRTPLGNSVRSGLEPQVDAELSSRQFLMMGEFLGNAGFSHYEISNFARPGFEAVHNTNYWRRQKYIGLGPSAHSFNGSSRQWNVSANKRYMQAIAAGNPSFENEVLTQRDRYNEYVMTGLRTSHGCDLQVVRTEFGAPYERHFIDALKKNASMFSRNGDQVCLTREGRLFADGVASSFFVLQEP